MTRSWNKVLVAAACGYASVESVRNVQKPEGTSKMIGEVPVLNYDKAYGGVRSLGQQSVEDWILVADRTASDEQLSALCDIGGGCLRMGHPSKSGMAYMEIRGTEGDLEKIIKAADGLIEFVEPDGIVTAIHEDGDENAPTSWGLGRIGAPSRANEGAGSNVFVLDTGIRASHMDFGLRVIPTADLTIRDYLVECGGDRTCAGDVQGHGSHCAGTAAGAAFGVAPKATLRTVKVLGDNGSGSWSWSYDALDFLATSSIRPAVASMSLGGAGTQYAMQTAVDAAVSAGVTVVVAGGNDNADACGFSPAFVPSAITVGSTTVDNVRSSFSNYGECTDIWAPGSAIISASHLSDTGRSTKSGTSMACPHVSGAAALILEQNPTFTPGQVLDSALETAVRNVIRDLKTGDTNALLWVGAGVAPPTPTLAPTPVPTPPAPTPRPPPCPSFSTGPDSDGDCQCRAGKCSLDGGLTFMCPTSGSDGGWGGRYFLPTCTDCECVATPAPTPAPSPPASPSPPTGCPSFSTGPDSDGDCRCNVGRCSLDGGRTFMCPTSGSLGQWGGRYFLQGCASCRCFAS